MAFLLAYAVLACNNQVTTQELLDANFLAKGQTPIDLLSPSENQQVTTANPTLSWSSKGVGLYAVQMATDTNFSNIVLEKEVSGTSYTVSNADLNVVSSLATASYYWRVKIARISNNLQSKTGAFFLVAIPANGSGYAGVLYVNGGSTSNVQVGSKEAPYAKIQNAISAADTLRRSITTIRFDILVAKGTYLEEVTLSAGISIRGGYDASDWRRNFVANTTIIKAPTEFAVRGNSTIATTFTSSTLIEGFTIQGGSGSTSSGVYLASSSPTISNNIITGVAATNGSSYGMIISSSSPIISNNTISGGAANSSGISVGLYISASSPVISNNTITVSASVSFSSFGIYLASGSTPTIRNNSFYLTGKTATRYGIYENSAGDNPLAVKNNAFFDIGTGGSFYVYRDVDGSGLCYAGGASAGGNCVNIGDTEADLNAEAAGTAGGNINQNPAFLNFPNKVDVTLDGGDAGSTYDGTTTTLEVTNCTDYVVTQYVEYDGDGIARQITACSTATGSGIVTFTPALNSTSVTTREIRLWGTNNANLTIDLHLKASSPCDVRQGGLDLSSLYTTDRDDVTRTATLTCGPANAGAAGWSIGAYEY